jgi:prefoldin subunit 5
MSIQPPTIDTPLVISQAEQRLVALRQEYETGQAQMRALEQRTRDLRETMLRISGAIAALEELLADEKAGGNL